MESPAVVVGPSRIGCGVFARRLFVPDEVVGEIEGEVINDPKYGSDYCMEIDAKLALEPTAPFRYLNHSCDPNCELFSWDDREHDGTQGGLWLSTLRRIDAGEELTIDYGWPAVTTAQECRCGSPNCRGWIVDETDAWKLYRGVNGACVIPLQ